MAHDAYLRFEGIEARLDSTERPGWARLLAFRHGLSQPAAGSAATTGDSGPGRASHNDFTLYKHVDEASPRLALMCCNGFRIPKVVVEICDSANLQLKYLAYEMADVLVRTVSASLPPAGEALGGGGGRLVQEEVGLRYGRITWAFTMNREGQPQGEVRTTWDVQRNAGG